MSRVVGLINYVDLPRGEIASLCPCFTPWRGFYLCICYQSRPASQIDTAAYSGTVFWFGADLSTV